MFAGDSVAVDVAGEPLGQLVAVEAAAGQGVAVLAERSLGVDIDIRVHGAAGRVAEFDAD